MRSTVVATATLASVAFIGCAPRGNDPRAAFSGTPVEPPTVAADAVLTDGFGRSARVLDGKAAVTFLFFGYTHCPDECPLALASLARAYRKLPPASAARIRIVFVTVDPAHDTPRIVGAYVRKFDPAIVGLSGSYDRLAALWKSYGVTVDRKSREIGHGDEIYAIDRTAHVVLEYPPDARADDLARDARQFAAT